MKQQKFTFINDKYRKNRGDYSFFYNIYCEHCGNYLLLYQKDGPGPLKRMYLDRIVAPNELTNLNMKENIGNLVCNQCKRLIAIPSLYKEEERKAYALLAYAIVKRKSKGVYPPKLTRLVLSIVKQM